MYEQPTICLVETKSQQEAIFRLWYDVYVEEMGRYSSRADHDGGLLVEALEGYRVVGAFLKDGSAIGSLRLRWGGSNPPTEADIRHYRLDLFEDILTPEQIAICDRFTVRKEQRRTFLPLQLMVKMISTANELGAEVLFSDCEPHLLNLYKRLGMWIYTQNFTRPEFGYMVPTVLLPDREYPERIESPLLMFEEVKIPKTLSPSMIQVKEIVQHTQTQQNTADARSRWSKRLELLQELQSTDLSIFRGLRTEEIQLCTDKGHILQCNPGDCIVKQGTKSNRTMYIVLSGIFEVRNEKQVLNILTRGTVFGELSFLTGGTRSADVYAVSQESELFSFREKDLLQLLETHPKVAGKLLYNLSRILCLRFAITE